MLQNVERDTDSLPLKYTEDVLHLKPDAYRVWANNIANY